MIGRRSRTAIAAAHRPKVQAVNHFHYEPGQMRLGKPVVYRGRQQISRVAVNRAEIAHSASSMMINIMILIGNTDSGEQKLPNRHHFHPGPAACPAATEPTEIGAGR